MVDDVIIYTPWILACGHKQHVQKWKQISGVPPEPFAPRHSITYFNNEKQQKRVLETMSESEYDILHRPLEFDPKKLRGDRMRPSLIWTEIYEENQRHIIPMTTSHWYGRPNRVQIDYPDKSLCRANLTQDFYSRNDLNLTADEERQVEPCSL